MVRRPAAAAAAAEPRAPAARRRPARRPRRVGATRTATGGPIDVAVDARDADAVAARGRAPARRASARSLGREPDAPRLAPARPPARAGALRARSSSAPSWTSRSARERRPLLRRLLRPDRRRRARYPSAPPGAARGAAPRAPGRGRRSCAATRATRPGSPLALRRRARAGAAARCAIRDSRPLLAEERDRARHVRAAARAERGMKVLVAGWFSFEQMGASAGDLLARDLVTGWLDEAGRDVRRRPRRAVHGGVDWRRRRPGGLLPRSSSSAARSETASRSPSSWSASRVAGADRRQPVDARHARGLEPVRPAARARQLPARPPGPRLRRRRAGACPSSASS